MKLKTLKEIIKYSDDNHFENDLKTEAVKWVRKRRNCCEFALCRFDKLPCQEHQFWMDRFNLTEKDLEKEQ